MTTNSYSSENYLLVAIDVPREFMMSWSGGLRAIPQAFRVANGRRTLSD